jgi:hypothetical protein
MLRPFDARSGFENYTIGFDARIDVNLHAKLEFVHVGNKASRRQFTGGLVIA